MAAKSPTLSPVIMEVPYEPINDAVSPTADVDKQLQNLSLQQEKRPAPRRRPSHPVANLTIHPATANLNVQNPLFTPPPLASPLGSPNFERSYLLENLQRQHDRGERLSYALSNVEVKLASAQSKGEARKLRKEIGLLRSKISESRRQVQLIMLRLNDLQNEDLGRRGMFSGQTSQQPAMFQYPTYWTPYPQMQPWSHMTMPLMSPMSPISPLTPLPSGLYHPSPMMPGSMDAPQWMQAQYSMLNAAMPFSPGYDQTFIHNHDQQQTYTQEKNDATPKAAVSQRSRPSAARHNSTKSVDFSMTNKDGALDRRRWSLADTFSPTPRDKRMSMPGLQTIWRSQEQPDEEGDEK